MFIDSVEKLKKGDEVIIPSGGSFRYYKLLEEPRINPKTHRFSRIKCSTTIVKVENLHWKTKESLGTYHTEFTPEGPEFHNHTLSVDFRFKKMWLLFRKE